MTVQRKAVLPIPFSRGRKTAGRLVSVLAMLILSMAVFLPVDTALAG